jgi:hypothetical protein
MKGRQIIYSAEELAFIKQRKTLKRSKLHAKFVKAFGRDDVTEIHLTSLCKRRGWLTGRTGCFVKGQEPANKGKKCAPGTGGTHPNARRTQFQKGGMSGRARAIYKPVGTERLCKDGYLERKIHEGLPMQSRWRAVHLVEWEAINGPVPAGHALKCLDGNRLNTAPSNWECVPRALLPRLNGYRNKSRVAYDNAPPELKPSILAVAKLEHQIHGKASS